MEIVRVKDLYSRLPDQKQKSVAMILSMAEDDVFWYCKLTEEAPTVKLFNQYLQIPFGSEDSIKVLEAAMMLGYEDLVQFNNYAIRSSEIMPYCVRRDEYKQIHKKAYPSAYVPTYAELWWAALGLFILIMTCTIFLKVITSTPTSLILYGLLASGVLAFFYLVSRYSMQENARSELRASLNYIRGKEHRMIVDYLRGKSYENN